MSKNKTKESIGGIVDKIISILDPIPSPAKAAVMSLVRKTFGNPEPLSHLLSCEFIEWCTEKKKDSKIVQKALDYSRKYAAYKEAETLFFYRCTVDEQSVTAAQKMDTWVNEYWLERMKQGFRP